MDARLRTVEKKVGFFVAVDGCPSCHVPSWESEHESWLDDPAHFDEHRLGSTAGPAAGHDSADEDIDAGSFIDSDDEWDNGSFRPWGAAEVVFDRKRWPGDSAISAPVKAFDLATDAANPIVLITWPS